MCASGKTSNAAEGAGADLHSVQVSYALFSDLTFSNFVQRLAVNAKCRSRSGFQTA